MKNVKWKMEMKKKDESGPYSGPSSVGTLAAAG